MAGRADPAPRRDGRGHGHGRRRGLARAGSLLFGLALALAAAPATAPAQTAGSAATEADRLRQAEARRADGDFAGAAGLLLAILETRPTSVEALVELEQVLRIMGDLERLVEPARRFVEAEPGSALGYQMLLRTYSALQRDAEIERVAEAWIAARPDVELPYREIARTWEERGDLVRAARVLERGRERLGDPAALALERAETYARLGDTTRSLEAWVLAVGEDGRGIMVVRRRLAALPDAGASLVPGIVERLDDPRAPVGRRRAALDLAIAAGLEDAAIRIARGVAGELGRSAREDFLLEMARRGDGARMSRLAYWAYSELAAASSASARALAFRSRLAELALAVGDTAAAREAYLALEREAEPGSSDRRHAVVVRLEVTAREGRLEDAIRGIEAFREEFPDAPELDELSATVAGIALERGDTATASALVSGVSGPQASLVRAQLALRAGDPATARAAFTAAAAGLRGEQATRALAMATLLGRLSPAAGALVGRATEALAGRATEEAVRILLEESTSLPGPERAAILDFAAGLAERNDMPVEAESIRRVIVAEHADTPEAPGALLALGRSLLRHPETVAEGAELLERLLLEYPRSALAPQARRELERLRRGP